MPRWLNILLQVSALAANGYSLTSGFVPPKFGVPIAIGLQAFTAAVGVIAHSFNPDGSNAAAPYLPAK